MSNLIHTCPRPRKNPYFLTILSLSNISAHISLNEPDYFSKNSNQPLLKDTTIINKGYIIRWIGVYKIMNVLKIITFYFLSFLSLLLARIISPNQTINKAPRIMTM